MTENKEETDVEKFPDMIINVVNIVKEELPIDIDRFDSWKKQIRVTANVFKFGEQKMKGNDTPEDVIPTITEEERRKAERYWILQAQKEIGDEKKCTQ